MNLNNNPNMNIIDKNSGQNINNRLPNNPNIPLNTNLAFQNINMPNNVNSNIPPQGNLNGLMNLNKPQIPLNQMNNNPNMNNFQNAFFFFLFR